MAYKVNHAVVIGAGTMGAALAAHLANAGVRTTLLDIVPRELTEEEKAKGQTLEDPQVRNRIVNAGLQAAVKSRPASFFAKELADLVTVGNLEDDFDVIAKADWVIEAIIENLKIKQDLMARIDKIRPEHCIISTNTSGIPVADIAKGRSKGFRQHFLGTHFFNPPRYLKLLEIIPGPDTLPEVIRFISHIGEYRLGKGIVPCKDTPNFIANRLGFGSGAFSLHYILEHGYTVAEVDAITGPAIGRPKTATFRLIDLVGVDVWEHVGSNLAAAIPHDEHAMRYLGSERANKLIHTMVERGWLGNKAKQGFYKMVKTEDGGKEFWELNLATLEYEPPAETPRFDSIGVAKGKETLAEKVAVLLAADDRAGQLVRAMTYQGLAYASERIPEIADTPKPIDDAMRWGFFHDAGPFEVWDMLGVARTCEAMKAAAVAFPPAPWVDEMLAAGFETFYQYKGDQKVGVYNPSEGDYQAIGRAPGMIVIKEEKDAGKIVAQNAGATLVDIGDGVACVEFNTKMNSIDDDILSMLNTAMDRAEAGEFEGIVVGNDDDRAFCAGANIFGVVMAAQNGLWDQLEGVVKWLQDTNMRMRYFPKPVVVAPFGLTLGGGGEITMHGNRVVAAAELYIGQVELGVGVIPAGGGTKELLRRIVNPPMRTKEVSVLPFMQKTFELIGMATVATSAVEALQHGFLGPCDRIVMNRDHLLAEAKKEVLNMLDTGYVPPAPEKIYAAGRDTLAALRAGVNMFKEGGFITEYESHIGEKLIYVMTGGELSQPAWVSEQYVLDLEREAFVSLCGETKTQERMWHMLQNNKVLRN
ncbi:MAG: 3-hydroxyacyl-CoA dehydrogenase/enoyl-CoA hydratase family protein [Chloroflexi bacterium]|nr:3-hydroxyacyl-CoA dehydrogenase/enoyl-CoA hydratase family protein [Chloroflexota bacterium]